MLRVLESGMTRVLAGSVGWSVLENEVQDDAAITAE